MIHGLRGDSPRMVSSGGGAFMNDGTRSMITNTSVSVWLKAELNVVVDACRSQIQPPAPEDSGAAQNPRPGDGPALPHPFAGQCHRSCVRRVVGSDLGRGHRRS